MRNPTVAVIVPAHNEANCIEACLVSLRDQTFSPIEIIVVDDGSTDGTVDLARHNCSKVLFGSHRGPGLARNLGAESTDAELLVFLDADMTFERMFVEKLIQPILDGRADGTYSRDELVSNWDSWTARCWNINNGLKGRKRHPDDFPVEDWVYRAIRRDVFVASGGYPDMGCGEDIALGRKIGRKAIAADGAICYHANPSDWSDVYRSARWLGRGFPKDTPLRVMLEHTLPCSIKRCIKRTLRFREWGFPAFKVFHDFAVLVGIVEAKYTRKGHTR